MKKLIEWYCPICKKFTKSPRTRALPPASSWHECRECGAKLIRLEREEK